ncbi:Fcf1-domain-containing protein [Dunaliella salina]|uniref:Fcf1-domain-containing protein n=1 Tax=Dunaliella salina TaxID=3046 RepID=A0ABQ7FWC7_DUNSA|nr:Fcf1-domain-containing protein [Dunaliella salina]|eukprot:KAF5826665.1 Fcf1-domain-containing protein [Dunaliella salina]
MRRKKHKHTRRAVGFYKLSYGFYEPFKILLDGNFIHATMSASMLDLPDLIHKLLGAQCKLYVTRCAMRELEELGEGFEKSLEAAHKYELHKCGHAPGQCSAAKCIKDQIGRTNANHWWLATQDKGLRQDLSQVAGLPMLFASVNGLHLEEPAGMSKFTAHEAAQTQMAVPEYERKTSALADLDALRREVKRRESSSTVAFRRKKAKGPNPLAIRKASKKQNQAPRKGKSQDNKQSQPQPAEGSDGGEERGPKNRKRKRSGSKNENSKKGSIGAQS